MAEIYWTLVDAPAKSLAGSGGFLSESELEKFSTLRFPKRRDEWLLGRWAAKSLVHSMPTYQHYSLEEIEIRNAPEGAPYIRPPGEAASPDCLSISHRDRSALCALTMGSGLRVGVDLEKIEPRSTAFVADYFTPAEQALANAGQAGTSQAVVTLIWSAKEAMLKALGVGLRWDTRRVEVREIAGSPPEDGPQDQWQKLQVADQERPGRSWQAWWQRRGPFILTLTSFATGPADNPAAWLVEKSV
ncbi:MAG TPA: 4'-phosphopantetheinyl transferase superfamily protein [Anaerolineales bacterium]|nr:4'-phosphopantetheinyl transferase superfamily protein [Anaerolineales bacterium]